MPTNNTGTLSGRIVIQTALGLLKVKFPALNRISTDFTSGKVPLFGQDIVSRIPGVPAVRTKTKGQPYVSSDTNMTDVVVQVNTHSYVQVEFDQQDLASTERNLLREQAEPIVVALGNSFMDALHANITPGNFPNEVVCPVIDTSRKTLVQLQSALNGRNVSDVNRLAVLNLPAYTVLEDDDSMVRYDSRGSGESITTGKLMPTAGFEDIDYYNSLPGTNGLLGYAVNNEALVVVARVPNDIATQNPDIPIPGRQYVVTDKRTGLSVLVTEYVDLNYGVVKSRVEWMFGTAIGNAKCLERLVSAPTGVANTVVDATYGVNF